MMLFYYGFMISLTLWTRACVHNDEAQFKTYMAYMTLMIVLGCAVSLLFHKNKKNKAGLLLVLVLNNIGGSIAYRMGIEELKQFLWDTILMAGVFVILYLVARYTIIYQVRAFNYICIVITLVSLMGARLFSKPTGGAYLYFCGVLIFGIVLCVFPFVVAYFMSKPEERYRNGNVLNLSLNMMQLLIYTFVIFVGCALCNEFGLLLVVGLTTTVIFLIRCKNKATKLFYSVACLGGVFIASTFVSHINDRILIWLDPVVAGQTPKLATKAESVLYLFRNFSQMGWYGKGIGNLPTSIYPTLNTDHVVVTLINDYGIIFALLVILVGGLFVKYMFADGEQLDTYDRYLNLSMATIVGVIMVVHIASNLGSFITAGIGFPFVSNGGSVNIMLTILLATHCGMLQRKGMKKC